MIRAHQPGSEPIDIPEVIPNPAVVSKNPLRKNPLPTIRSKFQRRSCWLRPKDSDSRCPHNVTGGREPAGGCTRGLLVQRVMVNPVEAPRRSASLNTAAPGDVAFVT